MSMCSLSYLATFPMPYFEFQYEHEVSILKQQLLEAQQRLQSAEKKLNEHESGTQILMEDWHNRLEESEERMRRQQAEKDDQMKHIIQRLVTVVPQTGGSLVSMVTQYPELEEALSDFSGVGVQSSDV